MRTRFLTFVMLLLGLPHAIQAADNLDIAIPGDLVTRARLILSDAPSTRATEKSLEQIVLTLATQAETPAARELIETLSSREPTFLIPHDEGGALIPFVDVGAAARVTLRSWEQKKATEIARQTIEHGNPEFLNHYFSASTIQQNGIIEAVHGARMKDLVLLQDEVVNRFHEVGGDRLAAALAKQLGDPALYQLVIIRGSAPIALQTVRQLHENVDIDASLALLQSGLGRADIASATLFEIGRLIAWSPAAESLLWDLLDDSRLGASAAAVLARHADSDTINQLIGMLQDNNPELLQQRIVLALKLSGDPVGIQATEEWLQYADQDVEQ